MDSRKLTKDELTILLPLTHNMCAMHDVPPTCENYRLVQGDHFFGEFAHIAAAKPGGQRYVPDMDPNERDGVTNRIVLCPNHHTIIDKKDNTYTSEQLLQIKADHEGQTHLPPLSVSDAALDEALAIANAGIVNINNNTGSGIQQVSSMTGTAPHANYSAARDVYIFNGPAPLPPVVATSPATISFYQPDQTIAMSVELTWLAMPNRNDAAGGVYEAEYVRFSLNGKRFAVLAQELAEQAASVGTDAMGKFNMEASAVAALLQLARRESEDGLEEYCLNEELQALASDKSLRLVIASRDPNVRKIPFEKLDEASVQCANPIKLVLRGDLS